MKTAILTLIVAVFFGNCISTTSAQSAGRTFNVPALTNSQIITRILRRNTGMHPRMVQALEAAKVVFDNGAPAEYHEAFTEFASTCESAYLAASQVAERSAASDPSRAAYAAQDAAALKAASVKFSELAGRPTSLSRETTTTTAPAASVAPAVTSPSVPVTPAATSVPPAPAPKSEQSVTILAIPSGKAK